MGPDCRSLRELKPGSNPEGSSWYSFTPFGESPCARVGHASFYLPSLEPDSRKGNVVIVGGANPNGSFSDSYIISLDSYSWMTPKWPGLLPRYEHAAFIPTSQPTRLWVYGGASETGNRNCVQVLNLPTLTWLQPEVHGQPPAPRHGHAVVAVENRLFIHGGLAGDTFYNDLFSLDITEMKWKTLSATGSVPGGRAAHSAVAFRGHLYIFGGMDPTGALDTMYKYHIEKSHWTQLEFKTALPPGRLDHSMCIIPWEASPGGKTGDRGEAGGKEAAKGSQRHEDGLTYLCLIFGGMDIKGEIYGDCVVSVLE
ncbi:hypothetical protein JD844_004788 [Phrynosoma platyrhinos]|uniref:Rab9 effector protein with kelch motifs n=1 Tax=Phrynosoma platyrhinos TaxID=52577 RepID=A0ABQ7SDT1_PHRPL|nr:hypothetical protein JD844_004788 [Phrynosoma platyrhinos]